VPGRTQRVLVGAAALLAGLVTVVVVVALLGSGGGSAVKTSGLNPGSASSNPPPPPRGSFVLAREAGSLAVALAVEPNRRLTATVLGPSGGADTKLPLRFRVGGKTLAAQPCGPGCYRAAVPAGLPLRRVQVLLPGQRAVFALPVAVRPAQRIVSRASRVFRDLKSLVYVESLRSDPTHGLVTTWTLGSPDRVAYRIRGGASAVVIGKQRWDRTTPHARWVRSSQIPPLQVPQPTWGSEFSNAHLLGTSSVAGRPVWVVSFVNSSIPAFFTAWIDRSSYHTLQMRMTAAAHFMFHRYTAFNRPVRIVPPRRSRG
jgi:hypothetical protein